MTLNDGMFTSNTGEWETPQWLFDILDKEFHFALDVCATADNTKCVNYINPQIDSLETIWIGTAWMNPPYGRKISNWVRKAYYTAKLQYATVVCLLPARTDTRWWWDYCRHGEVRFIKGRLKFGNEKNSAPFPSAVVIFHRGNIKPSTIYWDVQAKKEG